MKLTLATFNYLKDGKSTPRKLLVLSKPSDSYFGVEFKDESELDNFYEYLVEKEQIETYLKHKYLGSGDCDVTNYKRFKVDKIRQLNESKVEI